MSLALDNGGVLLDFVQIRKDILLFYTLYEGNKKSHSEIVRTGLPTNQNIRRFKKYFQILLLFSDVKTNRTKDRKRFTWRLNFLTLTIPAKPSKDDRIDKAFFFDEEKVSVSWLALLLVEKRNSRGDW